MVDFVIEHVRREEDYKAAFNLALSVFAPQSSSGEYRDNKFFSWTEDPFFRYENIVLAKYEGIPAGLIRIVPRTLCKGDKTLSVAGISSVCLLPELRGKGLSIDLMDYTLDYCKKSGYDLSVLFARRAADYYYTRFGFHGISSYSRVIVKKPNKISFTTGYELANWDFNLLEIYSKAYERTYANCFGKFQRTLEYWKFLLISLSYKQDCNNKIIKYNGKAIGYVIWDSTKVLEVATTEDMQVVDFILFIMDSMNILSEDSLQLEISPQHPILAQLYGFDITTQSRECVFGGHMLRILNEDNVRSKLNHGDSSFSGAKNINQFLSHAETCELLGVSHPTLNKKSDAIRPFDIGSIDHF